MKFGTIIKILLSVIKYGMILLDDIDTCTMKEKVHEQAHIPHTPPLLDNATYNGRICVKYTNNLILK